MSRYRAAFVHFLICMAVAGGVFGLVVFVWYPPPLFSASGGQALLVILIGVDVALGPLLTLIVFRAGKPSLRFDLACIAALQTVALLYGLHTVFVARPAYLVFVIDRFEVVTAAQIPPEEQEKATESAFRHSPLWGYRTVAAVLPVDPSERERILFASVAGTGADIQHFPQHYRLYDEQTALVALKRAHQVATLRSRHPLQSASLDRWLKQAGLDENNIVLLPVATRSEGLVAVLDRVSGQVLRLAPFTLW